MHLAAVDIGCISSLDFLSIVAWIVIWFAWLLIVARSFSKHNVNAKCNPLINVLYWHNVPSSCPETGRR